MIAPPQIKAFLITDSLNYPYYGKSVNNFEQVDSSLFSGLICAIGALGQQLFKKDLATITFGVDSSNEGHIVVITKQIFHYQQQPKKIYFAFLTTGECEQILLKEIATTIFIEFKSKFLQEAVDLGEFEHRINQIITQKFQELAFCIENQNFV